MAEKGVVVRRSGALGDVILTTPIFRRLRRENPSCHIGVLTAYPQAFYGNQYLSTDSEYRTRDPLRFIDLDLAYEKRPSMHIVRAYMQEAFGDEGEPGDLQQEMVFPRFTPFLQKNVVTVHAATAGWRNRTLPREMWIDVIDGLRQRGYHPV